MPPPVAVPSASGIGALASDKAIRASIRIAHSATAAISADKDGAKRSGPGQGFHAYTSGQTDAGVQEDIADVEISCVHQHDKHGHDGTAQKQLDVVVARACTSVSRSPCS